MSAPARPAKNAGAPFERFASLESMDAAAEKTSPCGVCGEPRPARVHYCRSCGHYDTWWERRPLPAAIRQIFIGTILVGVLGIGVQIAADAAIKDSDERQAMHERELVAAETLHEEINALRESLIRFSFRMTNDTIRCPYSAATDATARCLEHIRRLRQEIRQELFALDWTAPLLFAQLDAMAGQESGSAQAVEAALDVATTVGRDYRSAMDALDVRWARECVSEQPSPLCAEIQECRRDYASAEMRCVTFAACLAFRSESALLAGISEARPYESAGCTSILKERHECGDPRATETLSDVLCHGLSEHGVCPSSWTHFDERCRKLGAG